MHGFTINIAGRPMRRGTYYACRDSQGNEYEVFRAEHMRPKYSHAVLFRGRNAPPQGQLIRPMLHVSLERAEESARQLEPYGEIEIVEVDSFTSKLELI